MSEEYTEYYVSKAPKALRGLDYKRKRLQDWFVALHAEGRAYAIGVCLLASAAIMALCKMSVAGDFAKIGATLFALVPCLLNRLL